MSDPESRAQQALKEIADWIDDVLQDMADVDQFFEAVREIVEAYTDGQ